MLWLGIQKAEAGIVIDTSATVFEAATKTRVTKVMTKDTVDRDGVPYTEVTTTEEGPCVRSAFKILEKFGERWRKADNDEDKEEAFGESDSEREDDELDRAIDEVISEAEEGEE